MIDVDNLTEGQLIKMYKNSRRIRTEMQRTIDRKSKRITELEKNVYKLKQKVRKLEG